MTRKSTTRRKERRDPRQLTPHPLQNVLIMDLGEWDYEALKEDIRRNGLRHAVEITEEGVIIDGHQRVRCAVDLELPEILVCVRNDLEDEGAVRKRYIEANLNRRQMTKLEQARCYVELKKSLRPRESWGQDRGDTRDLLAKRFKKSGRTLDRLAHVLEAPIEVQRAYDEGRITLQQAGWVADLSPEGQQRIARGIQAGRDPKQVIAKHARPRQRRKSCGRVLRNGISQLEKAVGLLQAEDRAIRSKLCTDDLPRLEHVHEYVGTLIDHVRQHPRTQQTIEDVIADLQQRDDLQPVQNTARSTPGQNVRNRKSDFPDDREVTRDKGRDKTRGGNPRAR